MDEFKEISEFASSDLVILGKSYENDLGKRLRLGHSKWVIQHDMLGEGHQHFTPAGVYFQGVKELYSRAVSVEEAETKAMEYKADVLDAQEAVKSAETESQKLRALAKLKRAKSNLRNTVIKVRDLEQEMRDIYSIVSLHEKEVNEKYDGDIEKAQPDIWRAKMRYQLEIGGRINNIPMPLEEKMAMQIPYNRKEGIAASAAESCYNEDWRKRMELVSEDKKALEA